MSAERLVLEPWTAQAPLEPFDNFRRIQNHTPRAWLLYVIRPQIHPRFQLQGALHDMVTYLPPIKIFNNRVILGHLRLSIIDLDKENNQPFQVDNRFWIVFNGEIYNYLELKDELVTAGYSFPNKWPVVECAAKGV